MLFIVNWDQNLDANHQRPTILDGSEDTTTSIDRERGFMEILN